MKGIQLLVTIAKYSSIIPVIAGLINYKKLSPLFKRLFRIVLFFAVMEFAATFYKKAFGNNLDLFHFFTIVEFALLFSMFASYLSIGKRYLFTAIAAFTLVAVIDMFYVNTIATFNSFVKPIESLVLTLMAFYYYFTNLNTGPATNIFRQPMFWFSTSVLIYFSVNFFTFLLMNLLIKNILNVNYWEYIIHCVTNIIAYMLYAMAFLSFRKDGRII